MVKGPDQTGAGNPPTPVHRLDRIVVTAYVTTYLDGQPVAEQRAQPVLMFRATTPDVWGALEKAIARGDEPKS